MEGVSGNPESKIPFRFAGHFNNEPLRLKTCTRCHQDDGLIARGFLTRQNRITIQFLVEHRQMPPFPFTLSKKDEQILQAFMLGL
jgi:hypothetical protein